MKLSKQSYLTGTLFRRYVLQCMVWAILFMIGGAIFDFVFQRLPIYYAGNWYYRYRTLYTGCVCVLLWAAVVLFLTHRLLKRIEGYMKEIQYAAGKLVDDSDDVIDLSPELGEISSQLNQLKQTSIRNARAAREAEQRKNDLIMYLAHDLKTPLSSVIGYLTLLHDEPDVDEATRTRYLTTTLRKAERLDTLINEFFEITRFNLSKVPLQYHAIDLTRLLEQLVFEAQPLLDSKNLHCQLNTPETLPLRCDPDKMQRVFDNLLRNAILYSYANSTIQITVTPFLQKIWPVCLNSFSVSTTPAAAAAVLGLVSPSLKKSRCSMAATFLPPATMTPSASRSHCRSTSLLYRKKIVRN